MRDLDCWKKLERLWFDAQCSQQSATVLPQVRMMMSSFYSALRNLCLVKRRVVKDGLRLRVFHITLEISGYA